MAKPRAEAVSEPSTKKRSTTKEASSTPTDPVSALERKVTATTLTPITIQSPQQYQQVAERIAGERALKKEIVAFFGAPDPMTGKSLKQAALEPHRALCARENTMLAAVDARITIYDTALVAFDDEQQRIAKERAAEAQKVIEAEEQARRDAEIDAAVQRGDKKELSRLRKEPLPPAPSVYVPPVTPAVSGMHFTERVWGEVTNPMEVLCGITRPVIFRQIAAGFLKQSEKPENAKDKASLQRCANYLERLSTECFQASTLALVEFKEGNINALVKSQGGMQAQIPGITPRTNKKSVSRT